MVKLNHELKASICDECGFNIELRGRSAEALLIQVEEFRERHICRKYLEEQPPPLDRWKALFAHMNSIP